MSEETERLAAAYALGTVRGAARDQIESRFGANPAFQARAGFWQDKLAALDLAAPAEAPPPELFGRVIGKIAVEEPRLTGTFTLRAGSGVWEEMAPGVSFKVLFEDPIAKRRSILVRAQPGAIYDSHPHEEGHEECLILEGDLVIGDLKLLPGDFHVAVKGSTHPRATTDFGCLLYLSTAA
ncbi:MAG: cupin domain-containing protein [Methylocapsa sp.]|nr:cupin domain-containing protein [Methylocapsa sp.]